MAVELEACTIRLPKKDAVQVRTEAEGRGIPVADLVRLAVTEHLAREAEGRVLSAVGEVLDRHTDRLAALIAKVYVAAATTSWQANYLIGHGAAGVGMDEAGDIWRSARVRALVDLRHQGSGLGEAEEEEYRAAEARAGIEDPSQ